MSTENSLEKALKLFGIEKIDNAEKLKSLFDLNHLDEDFVPKIVTDKNTLIIFDNEDFNEAVLLDLINEYLVSKCKEKKYKPAQIFYINKLEIRLMLFQKDLKIDGIDLSLIPKRKELEKTKLNTSMITINPSKSEINVFEEKLVPFDLKFVELILNISKLFE